MRYMLEMKYMGLYVLGNTISLLILVVIIMFIMRYYKHLAIMKVKRDKAYYELKNKYTSTEYLVSQLKEVAQKTSGAYSELRKIRQDIKGILIGLFKVNEEFFEIDQTFNYENPEELMKNFNTYNKNVINKIIAKNSYIYYKLLFECYTIMIIVFLFERLQKDYKTKLNLHDFYVRSGKKLSLVNREKLEKVIGLYQLKINGQRIEEINEVVSKNLLSLETISVTLTEEINDSFGIKNNERYYFLPDLENAKIEFGIEQIGTKCELEFDNVLTENEMLKVGIHDKRSVQQIKKFADAIITEIKEVLSKENVKDLEDKVEIYQEEAGEIEKIDINKYFVKVPYTENKEIYVIGTNKVEEGDVRLSKYPAVVENFLQVLVKTNYIKEINEETIVTQSGKNDEIIFIGKLNKIKKSKSGKKDIDIVCVDVVNVTRDNYKEILEHVSSKDKENILFLYDSREYNEDAIETIQADLEIYEVEYEKSTALFYEMDLSNIFHIIGIHSLDEFLRKYNEKTYYARTDMTYDIGSFVEIGNRK